MGSLIRMLGFGRQRPRNSHQDARTETITAANVFRDGAYDIPHNYVCRRQAEDQIRLVIQQHSNAIIHFSGPSKSGKTVLARRFSDMPIAHVSVYPSMTSDRFWEVLANELNAPTIIESGETHLRTKGIGAGVQAGIPTAGFSLNGTVTSSDSNEKNYVATRQYSIQSAAISFLQNNPRLLIIDNYHWINPEIVTEVFPPLTQALGMGTKVIVISVTKTLPPTTGDMADFSGRVFAIEMPRWTAEEICEIGILGFRKLNVSVSDVSIKNLQRCAYFSPILMQGLCGLYCSENGVKEFSDTKQALPELDLEAAGSLAARLVGPQTGAFEALLANPGQRNMRSKPRAGVDLTMTEVLLLAISHKQPFEPLTLDAAARRLKDRVLDANFIPTNINALLAAQAKSIQGRLGGAKGDRSPIYYDDQAKTITIVDPYFKLWVRWCNEKLSSPFFNMT